MASGNKKRFSCRHRGYGKYCHRCDMAEKLEKMAAEGKKYVTFKKDKNPTKPKNWTKEEMLEEAARLRSDRRN